MIDHEYQLILSSKRLPLFRWKVWFLDRVYTRPYFRYPVSIHYTKRAALKARDAAESNRYVTVTPA